MVDGAERGHVFGLRSRSARQANRDPRAALRDDLGHDPAPVHLDELLGDAQPEAEPSLVEAEIPGGVPARVELGEERLEQVLQRVGFQADAPILHLDGGLVAVGEVGGELDPPVVGRELDGIGQQVDEHRADLVGVDLERAQVGRHLDLEVELSGIHEWPDLIDDTPEQLDEIGRAALEGPAEVLGAEQRQHVGDQAGKLAAAGGDLAEDILLVVGPVGIGQLEQLGQAHDQRDRRVELVAGDLDERRLELAGLGQLFVGVHELGVGLLQLGDQPFPLGQEVILLGSLADDPLELDGIPWFEDVAEDVAFIDCVDHGLNVGVACEQHADGIGLGPASLAQEGVALHPRHPLIGEDQLHLVLAQQRDRLTPRRGGEHPVRAVELVPQALQDVHFIIDNQ